MCELSTKVVWFGGTGKICVGSIQLLSIKQVSGRLYVSSLRILSATPRLLIRVCHQDVRMVGTSQVFAFVLFGQIRLLTPSGHDTIFAVFDDGILDLLLSAHATTDAPAHEEDYRRSHTAYDVHVSKVSWLVL